MPLEHHSPRAIGMAILLSRIPLAPLLLLAFAAVAPSRVSAGAVRLTGTPAPLPPERRLTTTSAHPASWFVSVSETASTDNTKTCQAGLGAELLEAGLCRFGSEPIGQRAHQKEPLAPQPVSRQALSHYYGVQHHPDLSLNLVRAATGTSDRVESTVANASHNGGSAASCRQNTSGSRSRSWQRALQVPSIGSCDACAALSS